ncbi:MAG: hypothetical protein K0B11_11885 [Mariniphaga sp.]|nr:hypothetical protein [Mariniphaga sp.]
MRTIFIVGLILMLSMAAVGQSNDKIIKIKGDTLNATIQCVTETTVMFIYLNENAIQSINKKNVLRLIYASGRIEDISTPILVQGEDDYEKVVLTTNPSDVEGLANLGEVKGIGKTLYGSEKQMRPKAEKEVKIQAAQKKAFIVFVNSQNISQGTTGSKLIITGTAYGY